MGYADVGSLVVRIVTFGDCLDAERPQPILEPFEQRIAACIFGTRVRGASVPINIPELLVLIGVAVPNLRD